MGADGRVRRTIRVPGTGIYDTKVAAVSPVAFIRRASAAWSALSGPAAQRVLGRAVLGEVPIQRRTAHPEILGDVPPEAYSASEPTTPIIIRPAEVLESMSSDADTSVTPRSVSALTVSRMCSVGRMESSQRLAEIRDRAGVRQHITHVSQCLGDAHVAQPCAVDSGDGGRAALGLHAVDQHGPAIAAQLLDGAHGVEQNKAEVGILAFIDQADINPLRAGWQVGGADSAQRRDCIDTVGQRPQSADVAEPDAVVVGMPGDDAGFIAAELKSKPSGLPLR